MLSEYIMNQYFDGSRNELKEFIPSNVKTVLEVGCGEGGFRASFGNEVEYWGVEPNKEVSKIAEAQLYKVFNATYEEVEQDIPDNYFDLIVCNDVIEHMVDHDKFLETIKSKVKDDGYLLISIPNVRYIYNLYNLIFKKDWEYEDQGILDKTHLRFFTKKSLIDTLIKHGYKIEKFEGINTINPSGPKGLIKYLLLASGNKDTLHLQFAALLTK